MMRLFRILATTITLLAVFPAAHAQIYRVVLLGANENPPVVSAGTGSAIIMLNSTTHLMRVNANFTGLTGTTTASHIHCCTVPSANAGVATTSPTFIGFPLGVTSGRWDLTYDMAQASFWNAAFITANGGTAAGAEASMIAGSNAGLSYLNVHSSFATGGEIRGALILQLFARNSTLGTIGAATTLDSLGGGPVAMSDALMALALLTPAQQTEALEKLTPTPSNGIHLITSNAMYSTFDQVSYRLDTLRLADSGQPATGDGGMSSTKGLWLKGYGGQSRQDMKDDFAGYRSNVWGLSGGFDRQFGQGLIVGGGLSYTVSDLNSRDNLVGNSNDVSAIHLTLYATQDIGSFYIDGMAAYAKQDYDSRRNTGIAGIAAGSYNGEQTGVRIGGGMPMAISANVNITPQLRLDWDSVLQDGYTESGSAMALSVASNSADRLRSSLGVQLDHEDQDMGMGGLKTRPFLRAFWHHDIKNDGINASASFVGGGARSFVTPGQELHSNTYTLGVGVNVYSSNYFSGTLAYDATLGSSYSSHMLEAKANWAF